MDSDKDKKEFSWGVIEAPDVIKPMEDLVTNFKQALELGLELLKKRQAELEKTKLEDSFDMSFRKGKK